MIDSQRGLVRYCFFARIKASSIAYFSCLAPDELVRFCFFRLFCGFPRALLAHLVAQLRKLLLLFFLSERLDLQCSIIV